MKDYLVDLCLVGLLIFFINGLLNNYHIQNELFNQSLESFEQNIKDDKIITSDEGINYDTSDNAISLLIKSISDICITIIKTIVLIISNFISTLL